jgi:hypothetical protein
MCSMSLLLLFNALLALFTTLFNIRFAFSTTATVFACTVHQCLPVLGVHGFKYVRDKVGHAVVDGSGVKVVT